MLEPCVHGTITMSWGRGKKTQLQSALKMEQMLRGETALASKEREREMRKGKEDRWSLAAGQPLACPGEKLHADQVFACPLLKGLRDSLGTDGVSFGILQEGLSLDYNFFNKKSIRTMAQLSLEAENNTFARHSIQAEGWILLWKRSKCCILCIPFVIWDRSGGGRGKHILTLQWLIILGKALCCGCGSPTWLWALSLNLYIGHPCIEA